MIIKHSHSNETHNMHTKSDNIEIMMSSETDDITHDKQMI